MEMNGMVIGTIKDCWADADYPDRIRVEYPAGAEGETRIEWALVMVPLGQMAYGKTLPFKPGTRVVLSFIQNNPEYPVVLGGLWNQDEPRPKKLEVMIEGREVLTIEKDRVTFHGDLTVNSNNITFKPKQNYTVEANQVKIKGQQTKVESVTMELQAQASGKINSSGIMEIKGSMLKLN